MAISTGPQADRPAVSDDSDRAFRVEQARYRFRAALHQLAGKPDAADLCHRMAELERRFHEVKRAYAESRQWEGLELKGDPVLKLQKDAMEAELRATRRHWRQVRDAFQNTALLAETLNDFEEPSDDELLRDYGEEAS
jgi:hypothetical protein